MTDNTDLTRAQTVATLAASPAFADLKAEVEALYDPARQNEPLDDALRCVLVTMNALAPKAATATKVAELAIAKAEADATAS